MDTNVILIWIALILGWLLYKKLTKNFNVFADQGVPYEKPVIILGNILPSIIGKEGLFDIIQRLYIKFNDQKVFGFFNSVVPLYVIKDPELIKRITIKDFDSFINHDHNIDEKVDSIAGRSLVTLQDEKWRIMRSTLSPFFTSSKMKMIFGMVSECALDFVRHFENKIGKQKIVIDTNDAFARYTVDVISTAALGFKGDCIENENSLLLQTALNMVTPSVSTTMKGLLFTIAKPIYVFFGLQFLSKEIKEFFHKVIIDTMKEREANNVYRPDMIQLLIQSKKGQLENNEKDDDKDLSNFSANIEYNVGSKDKVTRWSNDDLMAQGFVFFAGGFETTKTLLQMTAYELAKNREVQQELIDEVDEILSTLNGKPITYEALHRMKFLDQVLSETLRYWPPAQFITRECNKPISYDVGNGKFLEIKRGENVLLPIAAIHHDEKYFEKPNVFDPHRFDNEKKDSILPGSYIPFGYGPRVCIGSRFALLEAKLLIFNILTKFSIETCDKTPKTLKFVPNVMGFEFTEKIYVELRPRA